MSQTKLRKGCIVAVVLYVILAAAFYWICGDQLHYKDGQTEMLSPSGTIGEITADDVVTQRIAVDGDQLLGLTLRGESFARRNTGHLHIEVYEDTLLATRDIDINAIEDGILQIDLESPIPVQDGAVELRITAPESTQGNAVSLYIGNTRSASRAEIAVSMRENERVYLNGEALDGALCLQIYSREFFQFGSYYWLYAGAVLAVLCAYCFVVLRKNGAGKRTLVLIVCSTVSRYRFLVKQLVIRDFKTKYKRSALGVLWSFLNPLLTMMVQYIIFSTLFRSGIPNFAVYLLTGIVCFSFFNESVTMSLVSIVLNANLITKVYIPKYIYPLARVISSTVNFLLALIPLFAVLFFSGIPVRRSFLLLPIGLICLFVLCVGMALLLSASMVFFRDTQFLWGVVSMLWMYATPIFYPESIIPAQFMPLYKCNPLYHIIRFIRTILMEGISPEPKAYVLMLVASFIPLAVGAYVFKKTQDQFVLNI